MTGVQTCALPIWKVLALTYSESGVSSWINAVIEGQNIQKPVETNMCMA